MDTPNNERELLELAAKAAGYDVAWNPNWQCFQHKSPRPDSNGQFHHAWIPLTDDGDALRLAVKLDFSIQVHFLNIGVSQYRGAQGCLGGWLPRGIDDAADYRRAIVRAAAELGRSMP